MTHHLFLLLRCPVMYSADPPQESLKYKREVLARQFYRIRDTVKRTRPSTEVLFTPPYWAPAEDLWVDHPMLRESDGLLAEYSKPETTKWHRPHQAVIATPMNASGGMERETMLKPAWRGCGLSGYCGGDL